MSAILLLGPGDSRYRINGAPWGSDKTDYLTVIDNCPEVAKYWIDAKFHLFDLRDAGPPDPLPLPSNLFHEVHAYEVLNLLTGYDVEFFELWQELWRVMEPGGKLYATVPHWKSQWIHAYPAPQRTYTPGLLSYLDHDMGIAAKSNFDKLWPEPFNFKVVSSIVAKFSGEEQGFQFTLEKNHCS